MCAASTPCAPARTLVVTIALIGLCADAETTLPTQLYEVVIETGMPHLEENLRYAITREARCFGLDDLSTIFPILNHPSLADCRLEHATDQGDTISYRLMCSADHGTTGNATWRIGPQLVRGTLDVKLGGKNMTFYQHVTARALGACETDSSDRARRGGERG
jgi:hypothetical protein